MSVMDESINAGEVSAAATAVNRPCIRRLPVGASPNNEQLRLCRLLSCPSTTLPSPLEVIFVLDTSGSMFWVWETLAEVVNQFVSKYSKKIPIAVLQYAKQVSCVATHDRSYVPLRSDFQYQNLEQSCDHIQLAFSTLREYIEKRRKIVSEHTRFNVCYIADGGDTECGSRLVQRLERMQDFVPHNVILTTVACGTRFPTNTSLVLRKVFHDKASIEAPLLTPVEHSSHFEKCFETVIPHLLGESTIYVNLDKPVRRVPWRPETIDKIAVGSWFMLEEDRCQDGIVIEKLEAILVDGELKLDELTELGRQWTRELHANSTYTNVRWEAAKAWECFQSLARNPMNEGYQNECESQGKRGATNAFALRLQRKRAKSIQHDARKIMNELNALAKQNLSGLTDEQLAQRLAIGTRESKYLDRAVKWKGALTRDDFHAAREQFSKVYKSLLPELRKSMGKDPYRSVVSMESNIDVLTDSTFLLNLYDDEVSSQFALIECLPVVGLALKTHVSEGTVINPWLVRVDAIPRLNRYLDTASVHSMVEDGMFAEISAGLEDVEEVSAICPLVMPETAAALGPILRTKLYQILMTFQVTRNMDTVDKASHLALLASVLVYLLKEESSEWRNDLIQSVVFTASVLLGNTRNRYSNTEKANVSNSFLESLKENPAHAMVTAHPKLPKKCESISKALLAVAVLKMDKDDDEEPNWMEIWHRAVAEYVGRAVISENPERCWERWFVLNDVEVSSSVTFESVFGHDGSSEEDMQSFSSVPDIVTTVDKFEKYSDFVKVNSGALTLEMDRVISARASSHGPTDWTVLSGFESQYMKDCALLDDELKIRSYVAHAMLHSGSYERAIHDIEPWNESIENTVITRVANVVRLRTIKKVKDEVALSAKSRMIAYMRKMHKRGLVLPMATEQIRTQRLARHGLETTEIDLRELRYDAESGLCRRACQNNACIRFLIADPKFSEHLRNASYAGGRPTIAFHRAVQTNSREHVDDIEKVVLSGRCSRSGQIDEVGKLIRETYSEECRKVLPAIRNAYRIFEKAKNRK